MIQLASMLAKKLSAFFILAVLLLSSIAFAQTAADDSGIGVGAAAGVAAAGSVPPVSTDGNAAGNAGNDVATSGEATGGNTPSQEPLPPLPAPEDLLPIEDGTGSSTQGAPDAASGTSGDQSGSGDAGTAGEASAGSSSSDDGQLPPQADWETFFETQQAADDFLVLVNPATGEFVTRKHICTETCRDDVGAHLEPARKALDFVVEQVAAANEHKARAIEKVGHVENGHYAPSDEFIEQLAIEILQSEELSAEQLIERLLSDMEKQRAEAMAREILATEFDEATQAYGNAMQGLLFAEFYVRSLMRQCILNPDDPAVLLLLEDIERSHALVVDMHKNTGTILALPLLWDDDTLEAEKLQERYDELKTEAAQQLATEIAFAVIQPEYIAVKGAVLLGKSAWSLAGAILGTARVQRAVHLAAEGAEAIDGARGAARAAGMVNDATDAGRAADEVSDLAGAGRGRRPSNAGRGSGSQDAGSTGSSNAGGSGSGGGSGNSVAGAADEFPEGQDVFRKPGANVEGAQPICGTEEVTRVRTMTSADRQRLLAKMGGDIVPALPPKGAEKAAKVLEQDQKIREQFEKLANKLTENLVGKKITRGQAEAVIEIELHRIAQMASDLGIK